MADSDRIVYPDEVEAAKEASGKTGATSGGDSNSIEETPEVTSPAPDISTRNMISVPDNCPPGYRLGVDGVCREVL